MGSSTVRKIDTTTPYVYFTFFKTRNTISMLETVTKAKTRIVFQKMEKPTLVPNSSKYHTTLRFKLCYYSLLLVVSINIVVYLQREHTCASNVVHACDTRKRDHFNHKTMAPWVLMKSLILLTKKRSLQKNETFKFV